MPTFVDRTGQKHGRLTVIGRAPDAVSPSGYRFTQWLCRCECGNTTTVRATNLNRNHTKSCGCWKSEDAVDKLALARRVAPKPRLPLITYSGAHLRHMRDLGPASLRSCVDCQGSAQHWSYTHADPAEIVDDSGLAYSLDPTFYEPRCARCHKRFDMDR